MNITDLAATTTVHAAADLVSMSHQVYYVAAAVGGTLFIVGGIVKALHSQHKIGTGAAFAAFFGGLALSIAVGSAIALRDIGAHELQQRTGITQQTNPYGQ
jgi:hypothetical protein